MVSFFKKIIVFLIPVGFIFLLPVTVIYLGKEYLSIKEVVALQSKNQEVIFNFAYNGSSHLAYKQALIDAKSPRVVVFGTSRVMEIRKEFFIDQESFVNAGCPCMSKTLGDIEFFIEQIDASSSIQLIMLGLDREMFYKKDSRSIDTEFSKIIALKDTLFLTSKNIYLDYFSHKYSLSDIYRPSNNNIGISAMVHGNGFRSDGSYLYAKEKIDKNRNENVRKLIEIEKQTILKTNHSTSVAETKTVDYNLEKLKTILELCHEKGITVIGFTLPYPEPIYSDMKNSSGVYNDMVTVVPEKLSLLFKSYKMEFFDIPSQETLKAKDTEFVDSLHGTDVMALRMMLYMGERSKKLNEYSSMQTLRTILRNTQGDFLNF